MPVGIHLLKLVPPPFDKLTSVRKSGRCRNSKLRAISASLSADFYPAPLSGPALQMARWPRPQLETAHCFSAGQEMPFASRRVGRQGHVRRDGERAKHRSHLDLLASCIVASPRLFAERHDLDQMARRGLVFRKSCWPKSWGLTLDPSAIRPPLPHLLKCGASGCSFDPLARPRFRQTRLPRRAVCPNPIKVSSAGFAAPADRPRGCRGAAARGLAAPR